MNKKSWWIKFVPYLSIFALLLSSYLIERWHESLERSWRMSMDLNTILLRNWSYALLAFLYSILGLLLFRFLSTHINRYASITFLCIGLFIIFYPPVKYSFPYIGSIPIRLPMGYFTDSIFFFTGAMIASIGFLNLVFPLKEMG